MRSREPAIEKLRPLVLHTQSAAEYWHRSGSLVHTDPGGQEDYPTHEGVYVYAFGGTQHGPAGGELVSRGQTVNKDVNTVPEPTSPLLLGAGLLLLALQFRKHRSNRVT